MRVRECASASRCAHGCFCEFGLRRRQRVFPRSGSGSSFGRAPGGVSPKCSWRWQCPRTWEAAQAALPVECRRGGGVYLISSHYELVARCWRRAHLLPCALNFARQPEGPRPRAARSRGCCKCLRHGANKIDSCGKSVDSFWPIMPSA